MNKYTSPKRSAAGMQSANTARLLRALGLDDMLDPP
jgi:hypothetical protein